jgi:hypothetical protein
MAVRRLGAVFAGAIVLCVQTASAEVHATNEFVDGSTRPVSILLLPAQVGLVKQRLIRREAQVDESADLERYLTDAVANELTARGYELETIDPQAIGSDPVLQELYLDASRRYAEFLTNIGGRLSKRVDTRQYNAGDEMKLLAAHLGVDAVAFVQMQLVGAARGVQILNQGLGGTSTTMSVSIIDGTTSDIEAFVTLPILKRGKVLGGYADIMDNPAEEMSRYAAATLDDLPEADPALRVAESEEDVLSDLESLLE